MNTSLPPSGLTFFSDHPDTLTVSIGEVLPDLRVLSVYLGKTVWTDDSLCHALREDDGRFHAVCARGTSLNEHRFFHTPSAAIAQLDLWEAAK